MSKRLKVIDIQCTPDIEGNFLTINVLNVWATHAMLRVSGY